MKIKFIYIALFSFIALNVHAQKAGVRKADKNFDKLAYIDAIKTYERVAEKGYKTPEMLQKIGDAYYYNADLVNAEKWYGQLFAMTEEVEPEYFFRYAQSLKGIGNYPKADEMMAKFNTKSGNDTRGLLAKKQKDYRAEITKNSGRYKIEDAGVNSEYSDYGPAFFLEQVVFTSTRDTGNFTKRKHSWTDQYFSNLYVADKSAEGALSGAGRYGKKLNTKFHESTPAYTKDGKTVYFTRNNFLDGKKGKDANKITLLKIYKATLEDEKWVNIIALPFNSDNYQVAHPTLSTDEKTLYFASDMPGTKGLSDLYKVEIKEDGAFGTPVNLGTDINTEGRETFPFITSDNELYFASDGHPGLGGLDIFVTKLEKDGAFKQVHNIGESANSQYDDFALIINKATKLGYLTSNRPGVGNDDIYRFLETREIDWDCEQVLVGIVTDKETGLILPGTKLTLFDEKFTKLKETISGVDGRYDFGVVDCEKKYYVRAEKELYTTKEVPVIIAKETGITELPIELETVIKAIPVGGDLADVFGINLIYFDLDKWNIRPDAAIDIAKILDVLNEYPTMTIDIRSHTDSRQTNKYNEVLSDRRAKSTRNWLIKNGIAPARLTAKGYGETQLVNKCADGVECSEAEHQLNRRSQFIITAL
jgi:outer membrane protein OmpA-like peptidoglycan-associated protein